MLTLVQKEIMETLKQFETIAVSKTDDDIISSTREMDSKYGLEPTYTHNIDGILIDIGARKQSLRLVIYARKRLRSILHRTREEFPSYNMGNALLVSGELKYGNSIDALLKIQEPREAREYFSSIPPGRSYPRAYTNLANILEAYGRNFEAIQIYDKVLKVEPAFGMALGNKAKALLYYYDLNPEKNPEIIYQAKDLLVKAIAESSTVDAGGVGALNNFQAKLSSLEEFIAQHHIKRPSFKEPLGSISKYERFCMEKNLYLNLCFNCFRCKRGFVDSLPVCFIDKVSEISMDDSFRYSGYSRKTYYSIKTLNQIYEDYATARYSYFLATSRKFDSYDKSTEFIYALDYCRNSIQFGLTKVAYIRLYNILDKLAHLVFTNYGLEHSNIYFRELKSTRFETLIQEKKSWQLLALHSMAWDLNKKQIFYHLQRIRNFLTHEFIDIGDAGRDEEEYYREHHLSEQSLNGYTEELFLLAKSALIYFISALHHDRKIGKKSQGPPLTMPLHKQRRFFQ
jgi:hypothetical protein